MGMRQLGLSIVYVQTAWMGSMCFYALEEEHGFCDY